MPLFRQTPERWKSFTDHLGVGVVFLSSHAFRLRVDEPWRRISPHHLDGHLAASRSKHPGGLQIQDELDFGGLLHRQVSGLLALEYAACMNAGEAIGVRELSAVAREAASRQFAKWEDRRHSMTHVVVCMSKDRVGQTIARQETKVGTSKPLPRWRMSKGP